MNIWFVFLAIGLFTYATRASFMVASDRVRLPVKVQHALRFVPVTVLPAIIVQELVLYGGAEAGGVLSPRLLAGAVAALVAWRTRNVALTIVAGMLSLLLLQAAMSF